MPGKCIKEAEVNTSRQKQNSKMCIIHLRGFYIYFSIITVAV